MSPSIQAVRRSAFRWLTFVIALFALAIVIPKFTMSGATSFSNSVTISYGSPATPTNAGSGETFTVATSPTSIFGGLTNKDTLTITCQDRSSGSNCTNFPVAVSDSTYKYLASGTVTLYYDSRNGYLYSPVVRYLAANKPTWDGTGTPTVASISTSGTPGVMCVDPTSASGGNYTPTQTCGFTPLGADGSSQVYVDGLNYRSGTLFDGVGSGITNATFVGTQWFFFNRVNSNYTGSGANKVLCFDFSTLAACANQPFSVTLPNAGVFLLTNFTTTGSLGSGSYTLMTLVTKFLLTTIDGRVYFSILDNSGTPWMTCLDPSVSGGVCPGTWPVDATVTDGAFRGINPIPARATDGSLLGICQLATLSTPGTYGATCYDSNGGSISTPTAITDFMANFALSVPGGNFIAPLGYAGEIHSSGNLIYSIVNSQSMGNATTNLTCFDFSTDSVCPNFSFSQATNVINLAFSLVPDQYSPGCLWLVSDGQYKSGAIREYPMDALTGGLCNATSTSVPVSAFGSGCSISNLQNLSITDPASPVGTVSVTDAAGNLTLDNTSASPGLIDSLDLTTTPYNVADGSSNFLISVTSPASPTSITVTLTWTSQTCPSWVDPNINQATTTTTTSSTSTTTTAPGGTTTTTAPSGTTTTTAPGGVTTTTNASTGAITFYANGGTGSMSGSIANGSALPMVTLVRPGYVFVGWNTQPSGYGTSFADGASVTSNAPIDLYAIWQPVNHGLCTVYFDTDSYLLTRWDGRNLHRCAALIQERGYSSLIVRAFTDHRGAPGYNKALSHWRAVATRRRLIWDLHLLGINDVTVTVSGRGVSRQSPVLWRNRRASVSAN